MKAAVVLFTLSSVAFAAPVAQEGMKAISPPPSSNLSYMPYGYVLKYTPCYS